MYRWSGKKALVLDVMHLPAGLVAHRKALSKALRDATLV